MQFKLLSKERDHSSDLSKSTCAISEHDEIDIVYGYSEELGARLTIGKTSLADNTLQLK